MSSNNFVFLRGDVAQGLYFDRVPGAGGGNDRIPFLRFHVRVPRDSSQPNTFPHDPIRVVSYGLLAERMYPLLEAGSKVHVTGWLQYRAKRRVLEVVANEIQTESAHIASKDMLEQLQQLAEQHQTSVSDVLEMLLTPQLEAVEQGGLSLVLEGQTDHGD